VLGLVLNCVVLWTTTYLNAAVEALTAQGYHARDDDVARLSPFVRKPLGVHGSYSFTLPDLAPGAIRELRDPDAAGEDDDGDAAATVPADRDLAGDAADRSVGDDRVSGDAARVAGSAGAPSLRWPRGADAGEVSWSALKADTDRRRGPARNQRDHQERARPGHASPQTRRPCARWTRPRTTIAHQWPCGSGRQHTSSPPVPLPSGVCQPTRGMIRGHGTSSEHLRGSAAG
jgi:hypothetical protein